ncbi:glycosyltransferase family 4 protein [Candidatus Fermentibacteria bacterium]|nr:glycosyltransferase family 4 protein [Candidatus Fermentibacteria bacterium]
MATVVVLGMAPLPWERRTKHFGLGTRTWQFTQPLLDAGHRVVLMAKMMFEAYDADDAQPEFPSLSVTRVDADSFHDIPAMRRAIADADPTCVVGVNMEAASVACRTDVSVPIWADLNGYSMGEAQARHRIVGEGDDPFRMWMQLTPILMRADILSAVSAPQRCALVGELGAVGRLCGPTFGYEFVYHIPNGVEPPPEPWDVVSPLEGLEVPDNVLWALWSGGFNTWADPLTLVDGLELAMDRVPELYFASTGGELGAHDPVTYRRFRGLVEASAYRDRFHLLGWLDSDRVDRVMREAHIGLNVDSLCYETEFGARNRLNAMMRYGMPLITTYGSEISRIIERHGLGIVIGCHDHKALAGALVWAVRNRDRMRSMGLRAQEFALEKFSFSATTKRLVAWVDSPEFAPDNAARRQGGTGSATELQRRMAILADIPGLEEDRAELLRIQRTTAFRMYHRLRQLRAR